MHNYSLRTLTIADHETVLDLWRQTEGLHIGESDTRDAINSFLTRNAGLSLVATQSSGEIVAAVLCGHDGRRGYLHHLAVANAHRKQGIGRAIVNRCLERLHAQGITRCNIFLLADNESGKIFWQHEGWKTRADVLLVQKLLDPTIDD